MAAPSSLRSIRNAPWICQPCQKRSMVTKFTTRAKHRRLQARGERWKFGEKLEAADTAWAEQAMRIRNGTQKSLWQTLKDRGFIHQITGDEKELERIMIDKRIGVYAGVDPTGPSMHVGHLLPFMVLLWFYIHGYKAVSLLGGSTSRIGDPTGRSTSRDQQESSVRKANMASMHLQITKIWENMETYATQKYGYKREPIWSRALVNNNKWWNKLPVMEFMHYAGALARVGPLLSRDTAKRKLEGDTGLSFAELGYPIMQGWDWWELFKQQDVQVQIGGSDQFGNIVAGLEVVDRILPRVIDSAIEPEKFSKDSARFGITVPLLTTSTGEKIGKSAGNAIWLDHDMTPPFELYQYFLKLSDSDAIRLLKLFTLIPLDEIQLIAEEHYKHPEKRSAHHRLAFEVLMLVHGPPCATEVAEQHNALFGKRRLPMMPPKQAIGTGRPNDINVKTNPNATPVDAQSMWSYHSFLPRSLVADQTPARILYHAGLVGSRSEGQRLITAGGAYYGGETGMEKMPASAKTEMPDELKFVKITNPDVEFSKKMFIGNDTMILRTGRTKVKIIKILEDDEFDRRQLTAQGWDTFKEERRQQVDDLASVQPDSPKRTETAGL